MLAIRGRGPGAALCQQAVREHLSGTRTGSSLLLRRQNSWRCALGQASCPSPRQFLGRIWDLSLPNILGCAFSVVRFKEL